MFKYETDSRKIEKGQIFVALKGYTVDGHDFIDEAIEKGASLIISEKDLDIKVPYIKVDNTYTYLKKTLYKEYGQIIKKLKIIGVTGTNGKTTSCFLTYQMLNKLGIKTAYIGTIGFYYENEDFPLENTTPDILNIYKLLTFAVEKECEVVVMEVSSHSLSYDRVYGIKYDEIAFTNLTEDHLDYYKTMENYLKAKTMLLDKLKKGAKIIANSDDPAYINFKKKNHKFYTLGTTGDYQIADYTTLIDKSLLTLKYQNRLYNITIPLTNHYNIYNYLTMLALVHQLGFKIEDIINNTSNLKAPKGRCEVYNVKEATVIIDYAHTPDAIEKVINAYLSIKKRKIITLLGCGGERDRQKRPIIGDIATSKSDYVFFTNDNPRNEDPNIIIDDILEGVKNDNYKVVLDRKEAIKEALDMLQKDDILLLLGKGHEQYQVIGTTKYHFNDAEEVLNYK